MDKYTYRTTGDSTEHELQPLRTETVAPSEIHNLDSGDLRQFEMYPLGNDDHRTAYGDDRADEKHDSETVSTSSAGPERETWGSSLDFILSLLGYAVGLGNLWRFPYLCMKNGGGAFLVPFVVCLITCGVPMFFLEVSVGQFVGKNCLDVWIVWPLFKGIGFAMLIVTSVFNLYYTMIIAWTLYYIVNSFRTSLPWTSCDGWWNTDSCSVPDITDHGGSSLGNNSSGDVATNASYYDNVTTPPPYVWMTPRTSPEEEFWQYNVLQISPGIHDWGSLNWYMAICLFAAWMLVFLCIMKGVKSIGKVVYVTALLPYVLLTVFLVKGLTLPGAGQGVMFYLSPDVSKMMKIQVWVEAALQVFYSLGPGWGPLISMASYNKFNNNCLRDSLLVPIIGEATSLFSGLVVFTILGFIAHDMGVPIEQVVSSGPGLGFIAYPQAIARLPVPQLWSVLFFFMLLTVGLDSLFTGAESVLAAIIDTFPRLRRRRLLVSLAVCVAMFLIGLPLFCFRAGIYVFTLVDWYMAIFAVPIIGILECLIFGWIYGADRLSRDIEMMIGTGIQSVFLFIFRFCWCFVTPLMLLCCLIFTLMSYRPPTYGAYAYPKYAQAVGWCIAALPIIPIPVVAVYRLWLRRNLPFIQSLRRELSPSTQWLPGSEKHRAEYLARSSQPRGPVLYRIRRTLLGH